MKMSRWMGWGVNICVLLVAGSALYAFYPLYCFPSPTIPSNISPSDHVTWTFKRRPSDPEVYQSVTIWSDGRNEVVVTRRFGDPDVGVFGPLLAWRISSLGDRGLRVFRRNGILSKKNGRVLFQRALEAGVADIRSEPAGIGSMLTLDIALSGKKRIASGPDVVFSAFAFPPSKWVDLTRWKNVASIVDHDRVLGPLMRKRDFNQAKRTD